MAMVKKDLAGQAWTLLSSGSRVDLCPHVPGGVRVFVGTAEPAAGADVGMFVNRGEREIFDIATGESAWARIANPVGPIAGAVTIVETA